MENPSNRLQDNLSFKSLLIPSWFGLNVEDWAPMEDIFEEFFSTTIIPGVVQKLLDTENSPQYWMESKAWPYPDKHYLQSMCDLIDEHVADNWPIAARIFLFTWCLQHLRQAAHSLLWEVYNHNLQKQ